MLKVSKDDVIRALKKCKRLAKQDLLLANHCAAAEFWRRNAEVRRDEYTRLMEEVERNGVDATYRNSLERYMALPRIEAGDDPARTNPEIAGCEQALEIFFTLLGVDRRVIVHARNGRRRTSRYALQTARQDVAVSR